MNHEARTTATGQDTTNYPAEEKRADSGLWVDPGEGADEAQSRDAADPFYFAFCPNDGFFRIFMAAFADDEAIERSVEGLAGIADCLIAEPKRKKKLPKNVDWSERATRMHMASVEGDHGLVFLTTAGAEKSGIRRLFGAMRSTAPYEDWELRILPVRGKLRDMIRAASKEGPVMLWDGNKLERVGE